MGYFFSRPDDFFSKLAKTPRTNPEFTVQIERANASVVSPRPGDSRIIRSYSIIFRFNRGALQQLFKAHGSSLGLNLDALDGQTLIISAIKAIRLRKSKRSDIMSLLFPCFYRYLWLFVLLGVV